MYTKKEKLYPAYVSKHNPNREKHVILLMISNEEKGRVAKSEGRRWHFLAVKKVSSLLRGITCCLNCFPSFPTENKLQSNKRLCENKDFCNITMPSEDTKILEFNQCQKSDKAPLLFLQILSV